MKDRLRKFGATALLMLAIFTFSSTAIFTPKTAYAGMPVYADGDAQAVIDWILNALKYLGQTALVASVSTAVINTTTYAVDRLAYDAAVYIASGGNGEDPLFDNRTAGDYFSDYGASVAGDALGAIDDTGILGNFSLCEPNASGVTLAFKFGIQGVFDRPEPECKWTEVAENWGGFLSDVSTMATDPFGKNSLITAKLADMYGPKSNDLSVGIQLYSDVLNKAQTDAANSTLREMFSGFFKNKTNFITGRVETPAELIQKRLDAKINASDDIRNQIAVQALGDKEVLLQIAKHAGSVFTNTLLSKVTEKLYDGLFSGLDQTAIDPFNIEGVGSSNGEDARQSFRSFLTAAPLSVENYSQLQEFSACPSIGKSLYNCVADSSLVAAVSRADSGSSLTIAEAIEEGLLKSSWPLIPSSDAARDQDQFCYTYGYCHGNLVKLRKARIISTGWEIAAESNANGENSPVTLGEVVDAFNDCNNQGELDDNHPWCHLIDPNWVLKYPETQCKALVYGEQIVASVTDERQDVCVDMPSCIDEDGDGNCTGGYGYCVREENVWRFRGEECPEHYASCTTYENPNGESFDFLSNTTNSDNCTADSAGCLWYATQKEDGEFVAVADTADDIYRNRIYFTSQVADCESSGAGCKELVSRTSGVTLNMVNNPSFEDDVDDDGVPDGWLVFGTDAEYSEDSTSMLGGTSAVNPHSGIFYQPGIVLSQGAEYTYSVYARQGTGTGASTSALISLASSDGVDVDFRGFSLSGDCGIFSTDNSVLEMIGTPSGTDYERFTCTFTVPTMSDASAEITAFVDMMGGDLFFDEVQLEQESAASSYHEGYSDSVLDLTYVKVAPAYLGCTGDSATDAADCADYATMCSETDVGCSLYTPSNGDPSVAGIADSLDACPESCVEYDTFKQEATRYEPDGDFPVYFIPDTADECPAQAVGCDEFTDISTEAASYFTNLRACLTTDQADLNTLGADQAAVFYTWEGSDTDGYQLKTWNLVESDMSSAYAPFTYSDSGETDAAPQSAPCTSWSATATGITCNDDSDIAGELDTDDADCDEHDDTITNPDCREFYDASGIIHYRSWSKTVTVSNSCVTYRKTDIVGADATTQEANCSGSGGYYNSSTAECRYYGYADESTTCSEKQSGCREYTGGRSRNSRQVLTEYFEDGDLTNWDAASATDVTLSNESIATDGHSISSDGESVWTFVGAQASTAVCATEEGCTSLDGALGGTCTIANEEYYCGTLSDELVADKTYTVSFWAKGTGTLMVGFDTALSGTGAVDASFTSTAITLDTDWNEYSYGPLDMNSTEYPSFGTGASALVFTPSSGGTFFVDNIVLRQGEDNIDVIKDSWVTPAECDETAEGTSSPQYMLGCQEYTDQNSDVSYLKSFSSLCDESQVGCSAYFLTQESDATTAAVYGGNCSTISGEAAASATSCYYALESTLATYDTASQFLCTIGVGSTSCEFNLNWYVPPTAFTDAGSLSPHLSYAASTVVSPADKDVFLVVNSDVECTSDVAGCMEVGLPVFSQDHTSVTGWTPTYLMNIPADYATTLCSSGELFCDAWVDKDSSTHYFKNPQDQTCEYRTDVTISNVKYDGWFKTGSDELCATDSAGEPQYVIGGDVSGIWKNGDADYDNWVGTCLTKYDSCSEFQDLTDLPADEIYGNADGSSYYYLNNDSLEDNSLPDSQKCNGQVSQKEGCGLFNDTSEPSKTYNMSASYVASKHADTLFGGAPNGMADPIDCSDTSTIVTSSGESVDLCANRCWYDATAYYDINGATAGTFIFDGSCYDDSDCRPLTSESNESVTGFCASSYGSTTATRLENDANTVLKVNRDRECSEWLSCSDAQTTWDERTNSYKTICGDIGLCTEYSTSGNASFCSAWRTDDPAVVLDVDTYSQRDVSWYGEDYSGYAIPGSLPVDQLTQKNVAAPAGTCNTASSSDADIAATNGNECTDDFDCGGTAGEYTYCPNTDDSDYRLAYIAGACEGDYGDTCSIGYCENTGSPCATSDSCGATGGACVVGTCYTKSATQCASRRDCSNGDVCLGGLCATPGSDADIDTYNTADPDASCATGEILYTSVNFQEGTCMRDECVITPTGSTFDTATAEAKSCRGYPEINSPFPTSVVSSWVSAYDQRALDEEIGAIPETYIQNFDNVQTCVPGENCDCSYEKLTFGAGNVKYFGTDSSQAPQTSSNVGVCQGGTREGMFCYTDGTTGSGYIHSETDCSDGGGTCTARTKTDAVLGMEGYCLERDTSTNILGDRDVNACLTWLPVDQLQGSTDLYAKYTSAGYFEETSYCGYVSLYADVATTSAKGNDSSSSATEVQFDYGAEILCAEWSVYPYASSDANGEHCSSSISCPDGYFAVVGPVWDATDSDFTKDQYSWTCAAASGPDDDCPMVCVPEHAELEADSEAPSNTCEKGAVGVSTTVDYGTTEAWYVASPSEFTTYANNAQGCVAYGRLAMDSTGDINDIQDYSGTYWKTYHEIRDEDYGVYGSLSSHINLYPACSRVMTVVPEAVATDINDAAPYTDILKNPNQDLFTSLAVDSIYADQFGYDLTTGVTPFGMTITQAELSSGVTRPAVVASCRVTDDTTASDYETYHWTAAPVGGSCSGIDEAVESNSLGSENESRALSDFDLQISRYHETTASTFGGGLLLGDVEALQIAGSAVGSSDDGSIPPTLIQSIFARGLGALNYLDGVIDPETEFSVSPTSPASYTAEVTDADRYEWDSRASVGNPPSVWAVNMNDCAGDKCEEDQSHGLTLNDQNEGDVSSESFYRAYLKFFAAADKNQLPIRRVIVDWGDDIGNDDQRGSTMPDNYYKNHRGLQEGEEISICETDETAPGYEWGMNSDSCDSNYFSYNHIYTCNPSLTNGTCTYDADGIVSNSPCSTDGVSCTFRPRVHVRDNWGFCSGTCTVGGDGTDNCLDNDGSFDGTSDHGTSGLSTLDECDYTYYPYHLPTVDPWVYYDGTITVTP